MDRGAYAWMGDTKPSFEQGLRADGAEQRDVHRDSYDPPDTEAAHEERVNLTKQGLLEPSTYSVCVGSPLRSKVLC